MKKKLIYFYISLLFFPFLKLNGEENVIEKVKNEFNRKNYENVINILEKEKDRFEENPELNYYIGASYYNLKNNEKAKTCLENLIYKTSFENPNIIHESLRILFEIYWKDKKIEDVIKLGNYSFNKFQNKPQFSYVLQSIKYNLTRAYNETGNDFFWRKNYQKAIENYIQSLNYNPQDYYIRERLGEAYYNIGEYEKSKEQFLEVIKNEKNNWYILFLSVSFYSEISSKEERLLILKSIPEDSLSYKIFKSFLDFEAEKIKDGFEILKDEEEKRKTNGDITLNIINKIFPYDLKSSRVYMEFIKLYPNSSRNQGIINSLFNTIIEENDRKILEGYLWDLFEGLLKDEKNKKTVVDLVMNTIERRFDRRLSTYDDYLEKINMYEKFLERIDEDRYREEIMRRIADQYMRIEEYEKARENYRKIIELFGKENYYFQIAESYFKEGNLDEAEKTVENFLNKNRDNENAKLLLVKIYIEKGEIKKGFEVLKDIETSTKNRSIQREIENLKNNFFEMKEKSDNYLYIILRKTDSNSTRLIPEERTVFLNQITKEIEFYPYSSNERKTNFYLKCKIDGTEFSSEPYVLIDKDENGFFLKWEGEISIDKNDWKKKNLYKIIYPVKEIIPKDFDLKYKNESVENKFVLNFDFTFSDLNWEISMRNIRSYEKPLKIEPQPVREEGNILFWNVDNKNFKIRIEYPENKNIVFYFPEIEIKKKNVQERVIVGKRKGFDIENFEIEIDNFIPENIKIIEENIKIYNFKERIFRR